MLFSPVCPIALRHLLCYSPERRHQAPGPRVPPSISRENRFATTGRRGAPTSAALIDGGFQAFNAARLSEACHIYADKMLAPESDTTIGLTVAGALTPAGLGGCVIELMERGLVDFIISTGANLYHDLHYALNFTLHRGSPFLDDVELYEQGIIRIYDVLFPASVLLETDAYIRDFLVRSQLSGPDRHLRAALPARPRICWRAIRPAPNTRSWPRPPNAVSRSTPRHRATVLSA